MEQLCCTWRLCPSLANTSRCCTMFVFVSFSQTLGSVTRWLRHRAALPNTISSGIFNSATRGDKPAIAKQKINKSLAPGRCGSNIKTLLLKFILHNSTKGICPQENTTGLLLWQVNIGSGNGLLCQATNHYLSQCQHRSMASYGITRLQWVKLLTPTAVCSTPDDKTARNTKTE